MNSTEKTELTNDLIYLIAYILTSARGLVEEPKSYGPFRLSDTTGRLIALMRKHGLSSSQLDSLAEVIDSAGNSIMTDVPRFIEMLDAAVAKCLEIVDLIS